MAADSPDPTPVPTPWIVLLSCGILAAALWSLWAVDLPVMLVVRSLHDPTLEGIGDLGYRLGSGWVLAGISLLLLGVGWLSARDHWTWAGLHGLVAHAAVGLVVQLLKRTIGRPRPRLTHGGNDPVGPSLLSGFDAFPSGHASASFAVAAVLSRYFPRGAWLWYGLAGGVALSRVLRGSHFPTDVLAGAVIGYLIGSLVAHPLASWRRTLGRAVTTLVWPVLTVVAMFWVATHPYPVPALRPWLLGLGFTMIAAGLGLRWSGRLWRSVEGRDVQAAGPTVGVIRESPLSREVAAAGLIWLGVAGMTGFPRLVGLAACGLVLWGMIRADRRRRPDLDRSLLVERSHRRLLFRELSYLLAVVAAVLVLQGLVGVLPIL